MAGVRNRVIVTLEAHLVLNEDEARALDALVGYGDDAFLKAFSEKLGTAYMRDHHAGLKSFFKAVREQVLPVIGHLDQTRRDLDEAERKRREARRAEEPL